MHIHLKFTSLVIIWSSGQPSEMEVVTEMEAVTAITRWVIPGSPEKSTNLGRHFAYLEDPCISYTVTPVQTLNHQIT